MLHNPVNVAVYTARLEDIAVQQKTHATLPYHLAINTAVVQQPQHHQHLPQPLQLNH
jgi:hypothetical protein